MFDGTTIFYVEIWNHWLFGVPGIYLGSLSSPTYRKQPTRNPFLLVAHIAIAAKSPVWAWNRSPSEGPVVSYAWDTVNSPRFWQTTARVGYVDELRYRAQGTT